MNTRLGHDAGIHWENLTGRYVSVEVSRPKFDPFSLDGLQ